MLNTKLQGVNTILVGATPEEIWSILEDSSRVPEYMQAVKEIDMAPGSKEAVGAIRSCQVELQGRRGEVVERCTELEPARRLTHVVERDSFGFNRLFDGFGFTFLLDPQSDGRILVRLEGFYREKGLQSRVLNALVMRRKLHRIREKVLTDLKLLVESEPPASRR